MQAFRQLAQIHHITLLLSQHLQTQDPVLAEFIIKIANESSNFAKFHEKLKDLDADLLSLSLIQSIWDYLNNPQSKPKAIQSHKDEKIHKNISESEIDEGSGLSVKNRELPTFLRLSAATQANSELGFQKNSKTTEKIDHSTLQKSNLSSESSHRHQNIPFGEPNKESFKSHSQCLSSDKASFPQATSSIDSDSSKAFSSSIPTLPSELAQLPVATYREQLLSFIQQNQVVVIVGETGSGKSTLIPQFLLQASFNVAVTQPRRLAAISIAKHVAELTGSALGKLVGYSVRFDDCFSASETRLKYLTDGMLLREMLSDSLLSQYTCVMLDEAHERTLNTDIAMGLLKELLVKRPKLKLLITSATMDSEKFSDFFDGAPVFTVPGRTFPVEIIWCDADDKNDREKKVKAASKEKSSQSNLKFSPSYPLLNVPDYQSLVLSKTIEIHKSQPPGDVLVFLTGQEEIDSFIEQLQSQSHLHDLMNFLALPAYAALSSEAQSRIFDAPSKPKTRKIIVATNIAETSLTIPGIRYVIDSGLVKQKAFNPRLGMEQLQIVRCSQAQAAQRAGRAGRTAPGICYRLYGEEVFAKEMPKNTRPEVQRANLASVVLTLKAIGWQDPFSFHFLDRPSSASLAAAMKQLWRLGALDDEGLLTVKGRAMASLPLDPPLGCMLLAARKLGCLKESIEIAAMLSLGSSPWVRPLKWAKEADRAKEQFHHTQGDHLTLLRLYEAFERSGSSCKWARDRWVNGKAMLKAQEISRQLSDHMARINWCGGVGGNRTQAIIKNESRGNYHASQRPNANQNYSHEKKDFKDSNHNDDYDDDEGDNDLTTQSQSKQSYSKSLSSCGGSQSNPDLIMRAVAAGFFERVAKRAPQSDEWCTLMDRQAVFIHPSSALFTPGTTSSGCFKHGLLLYHELIQTTKEWMRIVSRVKLEWLIEADADGRFFNLEHGAETGKLKPIGFLAHSAKGGSSKRRRHH